MDGRTFFYELGKLIYKIDGAYDAYGRGYSVGSANLLWILYALNGGERLSQRQICDDWAIPRSTANTIIKDLENKNYVTLSKIDGERREMLITLTTRGKEYADRILSDLYRKENEIYERLSSPEDLIASLDELAQKLQSIPNGN